jgi:hypothetical protein
VRLIEAQITITPVGGQPRTEPCRLITTLHDWQAAPAAQLAACYAQRWEIEGVRGSNPLSSTRVLPGRML